MKIVITEKKAETIDRMSKLWRNPLELSLCILLVSIVVITFLQVLFRYVFQISLAWTEELAREFELAKLNIVRKIHEGVRMFEVSRVTALVTDWF